MALCLRKSQQREFLFTIKEKILAAKRANIKDIILSEENKKDIWVCACGRVNDGNFCPNCGSKRPLGAVCSKCGYKWDGNGDRPKFCPQCGNSMI